MLQVMRAIIDARMEELRASFEGENKTELKTAEAGRDPAAKSGNYELDRRSVSPRSHKEKSPPHKRYREYSPRVRQESHGYRRSGGRERSRSRSPRRGRRHHDDKRRRTSGHSMDERVSERSTETIVGKERERSRSPENEDEGRSVDNVKERKRRHRSRSPDRFRSKEKRKHKHRRSRSHSRSRRHRGKSRSRSRSRHRHKSKHST